MAGFDDIKKSVHKLFFKKTYAQIEKPRDFISFADAKSVGIIFNGSKEENIKTVQEYASKLKMWGKQINMLAFSDNATTAEELKTKYPDIDFITQKEVTWYLKPKKFSSARFIKNNYDILLNLYIDECIPLQYVSAFSDAKFRVGSYQNNNLYCNDFLIDLKEDRTLPTLLNQIDNYLSKKRN